MKKFLISCFALAASSSMALQAETVTIHHETEGAFATELAACGTPYASITELIIEGEAFMNKADMMEIKTRLANYLVKLDLSGASFENNTIPNGTAVHTGVFRQMSKLKECVLPETLEHLGQGTFAVCAALEKINIPEGVQVIDQYLFTKCPKLHDITLPEGLVRIYGYAFQGCTSLPFTELPAGLLSISERAFQDSNVAFESLPETITDLGALCFASTNVSFSTLPAGLTAIADGAFYETHNINYFEIPDCANLWSKMPTRLFYAAKDAVERTFVCRSMTPPAATEASANGTFSNVADMPNTTVKVPYKAMDLYKETLPWSGMNVEAVTVPVMLTLEHAHSETVEDGHVNVSFVVEDVEHPHMAEEVIEGDGKLVISFSNDAHDALYVKEVRRKAAEVNLMADEGEEGDGENDEEVEPAPEWENIYTCADPANSMKQTVEIPVSVNADMGAHHVVIAAYTPTSIIDVNASVVDFKRVGNTIELTVAGAELFDTAGRRVAATAGTELSLAGLTNGIYILKVQEKTVKIVI